MPEHLQLYKAHRNLQLWQTNINKSLLSQQDLLISLKRNNYNICTIQEPYIDQNGLSRANYQWFTVYPSTHTTAPEATRSILLINTNLLTNDWKQILIPHPDIIAIKLTGTFGKIQLLNIYNNRNNNDTLKHITTFMSANSPVCSPTTLTHYMWLGTSTITIHYGMSCYVFLLYFLFLFLHTITHPWLCIAVEMHVLIMDFIPLTHWGCTLQSASFLPPKFLTKHTPFLMYINQLLQ